MHFFAYVNHARIRSWNQPVLKAIRVKFLSQGNNFDGTRNSRLTGIHRSRVRRATHCATRNSW